MKNKLLLKELIKTKRKQKNLTIKELAEALKVSSSSVKYWEAGVYIPKVEKQLVLCELLNITTKEFMTCLFNTKKEEMEGKNGR